MMNMRNMIDMTVTSVIILIVFTTKNIKTVHVIMVINKKCHNNTYVVTVILITMICLHHRCPSTIPKQLATMKHGELDP